MYGRFTKIQSNLRRKELRRTNQGSNFGRDTFGKGDDVRAPIQIRTESQLQHLKKLLFLNNRPSILTSIAPVLFDQLNETS